MRTRKGLPIVCTQYMRLILSGILARVQRDQKVTICHFLWMSNHLHMIVVVRDSFECTKFYGEVQKQITDSIKRLLGISHLSLWPSNGTSVVQYGDIAGTMERVAYIYANPAAAHLVDCVQKYPGYSTWDIYNESTDSLDNKHISLCPWIRTPSIEKLPLRSVSTVQDKHITKYMKNAATVSHQLEIEPNAWMRVFEILEEDVASVNSQIFERLIQLEQVARESRQEKGFKTKGARKLTLEPLTLNFQTKSKSKRIFVYAMDPVVRKSMIKNFKNFCNFCYDCYQRWKLGDYLVTWPMGAFLPAMPPRANLLAWE